MENKSGAKLKVRSIVKIHGGKYYLAPFIIDHFPKEHENMGYLEPFCGGASVLLNKNPSKEEIINDIDIKLINIFKIVRDQPKELIAKLKKIKYSETTFIKAQKEEQFEAIIDMAVNEFILRRMSRGGLKKGFAWSDRERGGQPGDVNAWETILKTIPVISKRLSNVHILNKPALELIKAFSQESVFLYADPPYLPETRVSKNAYEFELTEKGHIELASALNNFKGKVLISGYQSKLYKKLYKGWKVSKKEVPNHASQQKNKSIQTEMLWMNY
jgi:DNA adenine methylase